jgi:23S rRNA pseudouridine2604 synthase
MFEAVGYRVKHLVRVRIGNLRLADLPRGHWRPLTKRELESLQSRGSSDVVTAGADRGSRRTEHASGGRRSQRPRLQPI